MSDTMIVLNRGEINASDKVLISEQKVVSADAHKIIPDGCRIITLKEVLLHYTTDSDFRAYLILRDLLIIWQQAYLTVGNLIKEALTECQGMPKDKIRQKD